MMKPVTSQRQAGAPSAALGEGWLLQDVAEHLTMTPPPTFPTTSPPPGVVVGLGTSRSTSVACAGIRSERGAGGNTEPMTVVTQHDLASVSKIVGTTAALIRLVSDNLVSLDDPVNRFLPQFQAGTSSVTIRDLLLHRGGLWEWQPLYIAAETAEDGHHVVDRLPFRYPPHAGHHYSDLGFMLLGRVVSESTGSSLDAAVAELVTGPLGMKSTRYARPASDVIATSMLDDRAEQRMLDTQRPYPVGYTSGDFRHWRSAPVAGQVADGNAFHVFGGVAGHAGLFADVPDLLRFGVAFAEYREHDKLWRSEVVEHFFTPGPESHQALGFRRYSVRLSGEDLWVLGHTGFVGCAVGFIPDRDIALALASNRLLTDGEPPPTEALWNAFLHAVAPLVEDVSR